MLKEPPIPCDLKVGDIVTYTNEFGVSFNGMIIIGFSADEHFLPRKMFIHTDFCEKAESSGAAWWFPKKRECLVPDPELQVECDALPQERKDSFWLKDAA